MGVTFTLAGNWDKTEAYLQKLGRGDMFDGLDALAKRGVTALASATPIDTGMAASSWDYEIKKDRGGVTIAWTNSDTANGVPVVVMLQLGHGTGTGGYVQGKDFINPAIKPIFDQISKEVWKKVTS